jgi:hypothetical protein
MTTLTLSFDPRLASVRKVEQAFAARLSKRSLARYALPASLVAFAVGLFVVYLLTGRTRLDLVSLLPTLAFFLTFDLVRQFAGRRAVVERDHAPIRNRTSAQVQLGAAGIVVDGAEILWSEIIEVMRVDQGTILMILPCQGIPIPDEALPAGVNPETLMNLISRWRGK